MKKTFRIALLGAALAISGAARANCFGSPQLQTCNDGNGNSYTVNRFGNTTQVNGYNGQTGSSWNETANTYGNTTQINGRAGNGQNWSETIQNYGGGNRSVYGTDSNGNAFNHYCTSYGCN